MYQKYEGAVHSLNKLVETLEEMNVVHVDRITYRGCNIKLQSFSGPMLFRWNLGCGWKEEVITADFLASLRRVMVVINKYFWAPKNRQSHKDFHSQMQKSANIFHCETYSPDNHFVRVKVYGMKTGEAIVFR